MRVETIALLALCAVLPHALAKHAWAQGGLVCPAGTFKVTRPVHMSASGNGVEVQIVVECMAMPPSAQPMAKPPEHPSLTPEAIIWVPDENWPEKQP